MALPLACVHENPNRLPGDAAEKSEQPSRAVAPIISSGSIKSSRNPSLLSVRAWRPPQRRTIASLFKNSCGDVIPRSAARLLRPGRFCGATRSRFSDSGGVLKTPETGESPISFHFDGSDSGRARNNPSSGDFQQPLSAGASSARAGKSTLTRRFSIR